MGTMTAAGFLQSRASDHPNSIGSTGIFSRASSIFNLTTTTGSRKPPLRRTTGLAPPVAIMQAMPDSRQQSFEEIYGPPENFLEIEVSSASPSTPSLSFPFPLLRLQACLSSQRPGQEPPHSRHGTHHVHRLRDRMPHEHPGLQAPAQQCAQTIFGL